MYALWFMGFMLTFMLVLCIYNSKSVPITERSLYMALLLSVGSWVALVLIGIGMMADNKREADKDDNED